MFLNLRSVVYNVDDLEKAKEWYGKILKLEPTDVQPSFVNFGIGHDRLGLNLVDHPPPADGSTSVAYWAVSDIRTEYKRLLDHGAVELGEIRDVGGGILMAEVRDPFGNILGIGGRSGIPDNRAIEEKPSQTALWTTHMRALSTREENEGIRGPDRIAEIFLPMEDREALDKREMHPRVKEEKFVIGVYEYVMARTGFFDRFFTQALEQGLAQIVFLGAGYDSRSHRFKDLVGATKIFEMDVSPTQEHKKQCLAEAGIDIPEYLTHVPINFNKQSIDEVLFAAGFDSNQTTAFVMEGVTYYLAPEAVDATLAFIKANSPAGSIVAFDYIALWPGVFDAYGVKELIEFNATRQSGESAGNFTLEEGTIETFLSERGFRVLDHFNSEQLEKYFLTLDDGSLFGNVTGSMRVVEALTEG